MGLPDFRVFANKRVCLIEFKVQGREPSDDQKKILAQAEATGVPYLVTEDLGEAINFCKVMLQLDEHPPA